MPTLIPSKRTRWRPRLGLTIPPLMVGDHLTLSEFLRRYEQAPKGQKFELIEGIVFMAPPVHDDHSTSHASAGCWLTQYAGFTEGVVAHIERSLGLIGHTTVQPDVCLVIAPECGGQTKVGSSKLLEGSPELIFEIAASSANYDLFEKKSAYHQNRVQEYLVWRTLDGQVDWFEWTPEEYVARTADAKGIIKSRVFPGLWLNVRALLRHKLEVVLNTAREGLASPEHRQFVSRLKAARRAKR